MTGRYGSRELPRLDPDLPKQATERHLVADEMEPGRLWMLLRAVDQRLTAAVENAEMTDQRLERGAIAGRRDHRVDCELGAVGQNRGAVLEPFEGCDNTDTAAPHRLDEADIEDRDHPTAQELGVRPRRRRQTIRRKVGNRDAANRARDPVDDRDR